MPAARLSTAFDSVTLYGEDPDYRPDIYGKIGNSGVSIAASTTPKNCIPALTSASPTSVSMTINGPAHDCAFYMNAAIDQQCEKYIRENGLEHLVEAKIGCHLRRKRVAPYRLTGELPKATTVWA
jgi:methylmalonyl-CoA mutase